MSYVEVPEVVLRNCPLCGRVGVLATQGSDVQQFRIYCDGLRVLPPACKRETTWTATVEAAVAEWNDEGDVPLPMFPGL